MILKPIFYYLILLFLIVNCPLSQSETLIVAVPQNGYPPYIIVQDKHVSGILVDTLKIAAKSAYFSLAFVFLPEMRSKALLDSHEVDMRMESPDWVNNPDDYFWSEPITSIKDIFVFNRKIPNVFETDKGMLGAEINTHLGYVYPTLKNMFNSKKIKRKDFNSEKGMLLNLTRNNNQTIKAAVMDYHVARYWMSRIPVLSENLIFSHRYVDYKYIHFQFSKTKKMEYISTKLNFEIKKLKQRGVVDEIIKKNLGEI